MHRLARRGFEESARDEPQQIAIALLARCQQHQPRKSMAGSVRTLSRSVIMVGEIDSKGAADDRLDAGAGKLLGEFERTEHVVDIGERERGLPVGLGKLGEPRDRQRPFEQRIGGMHVQMHEAGIGTHYRPRAAVRNRCLASIGAGRGPVYRCGEMFAAMHSPPHGLPIRTESTPAPRPGRRGW
jgi:hypothetical protein